MFSHLDTIFRRTVVVDMPPGHLPPPFLWHLPPLFLWHLPPPTFVHLPPGQLPPLNFFFIFHLFEIWKKFSRILEKGDSRRLLVQSGKDHLISVVIAKFLYYFPQSIHLSFWFWYMCHWDISFPIFCDIIRPIFGHLPSHFLDAAASLASTG